MDAERVEILHIADGDTVAETVTHHLILDFLPAFETLLDEHLGEKEKAFSARRRSSSALSQKPEPSPPSAYAARRITG